MSETGPWGYRDGRAPPPVVDTRVDDAPRPVHLALVEDKGQNPIWAVVSTLLLGGLIWLFRAARSLLRQPSSVCSCTSTAMCWR
jgi:hypothetical protein